MTVEEMKKHLDSFPPDATVVLGVWTSEGRIYFRPHLPLPSRDGKPWMRTAEDSGEKCAVIGTADWCAAHTPTMKEDR